MYCFVCLLFVVSFNGGSVRCCTVDLNQDCYTYTHLKHASSYSTLFFFIKGQITMFIAAIVLYFVN